MEEFTQPLHTTTPAPGAERTAQRTPGAGTSITKASTGLVLVSLHGNEKRGGGVVGCRRRACMKGEIVRENHKITGVNAWASSQPSVGGLVVLGTIDSPEVPKLWHETRSWDADERQSIPSDRFHYRCDTRSSDKEEPKRQQSRSRGRAEALAPTHARATRTSRQSREKKPMPTPPGTQGGGAQLSITLWRHWVVGQGVHLWRHDRTPSRMFDGGENRWCTEPIQWR